MPILDLDENPHGQTAFYTCSLLPWGFGNSHTPRTHRLPWATIGLFRPILLSMSVNRPIIVNGSLMLLWTQVDFYEKRSYDATAQRLYREADYPKEYAERNSIKVENTSIQLGLLSWVFTFCAPLIPRGDWTSLLRYKHPISQSIQIKNGGKVGLSNPGYKMNLKRLI